MKRTIWLILLALVSFSIFAQSSAKMKEMEKRRLALFQEIETTADLLKNTEKNAQSQLNRINLLDKQIETRSKVIGILNDEVKEIEKEIVSLTTEINRLQREYEGKRQQYAKAMQTMQSRRNSQDKILFVLSAQSFEQSYRRLRYLKEYSVWRKLQAQGIKEKQTELETKKRKLEETKKEKDKLLKQREEEANTLKKEKEQLQAELQELKKQEKTLRTQLANKQKQANELNRQIEKQIAYEIAQSERERKAAAEKGIPADENRQSATAGGYAMNAEERKLSGDFEKNKGILPFPVSVRSTIVGKFGEQQHKELSNVRTNNNGIDIQAAAKGAEAKAVFNGEITKIFTVPGFNNSAIVRHGNYLTVYSNLDVVYVKVGQKVSTGQAIGRIFTNEREGNATILHFELWKERTKLNPEPWIRR